MIQVPKFIALFVSALSVLSLASGCSGPSSATSSPSAPSADGVRLDLSLVLADEPANERSVADVRENGQQGEEVVVAGWIAGSQQPFIEGRAAFTIVDVSLPPMDCAKLPWSFCCMPKNVLVPRIVLVKFVDEQGKTILKDARGLLGVKEAATVVVHGQVDCTEEGEVTAILADGLYVRGDSYVAPEGLATSENASKTLPVFDTGMELPVPGNTVSPSGDELPVPGDDLPVPGDDLPQAGEEVSQPAIELTPPAGELPVPGTEQ